MIKELILIMNYPAASNGVSPNVIPRVLGESISPHPQTFKHQIDSWAERFGFEYSIPTAMLAGMYGNAYVLDLPNNAGSLEKMSTLID